MFAACSSNKQDWIWKTGYENGPEVWLQNLIITIFAHFLLNLLRRSNKKAESMVKQVEWKWIIKKEKPKDIEIANKYKQPTLIFVLEF